MRVKISYSMELDEIPSAVSGLIDKCTEHLALAQGLTLSTSDSMKKNGIDVFKCLEDITNIRGLLMSTDMLLEDSANIIAGYGNTKINLDVERVVIDEMEANRANSDEEG